MYLKKLLKGFFSRFSPNIFQSTLLRIHKSFCLSVRPRMERGSSDVICFAEVFELSRCKLASNIGHYGVDYTKPCEHLMKGFYGDFWGWVFTSMYFGPL